MRTKEECLADLNRYGLVDHQYQAAKAELDILIAQEHVRIAQEYAAILQKTRENIYEVLAAMNSEILRFRDVVDRAAKDGAITSRLLIRWTKVVAITTGVLAFATLALVYVTIRAGH
jgi:hypothetical protein